MPEPARRAASDAGGPSAPPQGEVLPLERDPRRPRSSHRHDAAMRTFWTTADLLQRGKSERAIRRAAQHGALEPVRKGLYTTPGTSTCCSVQHGRAESRHRSARQRSLACGYRPTFRPGAATSSRTDPSRAGCTSRRAARRRDSTIRTIRPVHCCRAPTSSCTALRVRSSTGPSALRRHPDHRHARALLPVAGAGPGVRGARVGAAPALPAAHRARRARSATSPRDLRPRRPRRGTAVADSGVESIAVHLLRLAGLRLVQHRSSTGIGRGRPAHRGPTHRRTRRAPVP